MPSNEIVSKRLNSLRNITEQLKNSTTSGPINFMHIKSLIGNLKHISQLPNQSNARSDSNQNYPYAFTEASHQGISQNIYEDEEYRPLFHQMKKKEQQSHYKSFQESEIIDLRQQNLKLQQKLAAVKEELRKLKEKSQQSIQQKENNKLPYFSLREAVHAFVCRYEILEQNYQKLEYTEYQVDLTLDRVILLRKQKKSIQQFDLSTLNNVVYIDSHHILLQFQQFLQSQYLTQSQKAELNKKELTNLFLKFSSEEELHKWDLSLFINFKIVNSLHQKKLFQTYFRRVNQEKQILHQKNKITEIRQSKQLDDKKEKDLLELLIKRRQDYLQIRTLIQEKLGSANQLENHNQDQNQKEQNTMSLQRHPDIPEPISLINRPERASFSSNKNKNRKKNHSKNWEQTQYNSMSPSIIEKIGEVEENLENSNYQNGKMNFSPSFSGLGTNQQKVPRQQSQTFPVGPFSSHNEPNSFKLYPSNTSSPRANQTIINQSKVNSSQWRENNLSTVSKSKQTQLKALAARQSLQRGFYATKYSKDGFYPHEKKIFLSLDCKKLCWSQKDKESDYKGIPLEVITKIEYAVIGEGIRKHVKGPESRYYCLIQYFTGDYKKKTIQLGSGSSEQIKKFVDQLKLTVNNQRGTPLGSLNNL